MPKKPLLGPLSSLQLIKVLQILIWRSVYMTMLVSVGSCLAPPYFLTVVRLGVYL